MNRQLLRLVLMIGICLCTAVGVASSPAHATSMCNFGWCWDCGIGYVTCAWTEAQDSCTGFHDACICMGYCGGGVAQAFCRCYHNTFDFELGVPGSSPMAATDPLSLNVHSSEGADLHAYAAALENATSWGVVVTNAGSVFVTDTSATGPMASVINLTGQRFGFSATFNPTTHIITLTAN